MKTAKILQMIDSENNNISPEVGVDSIYFETPSLDGKAYIRNPIYPTLLIYTGDAVDNTNSSFYTSKVSIIQKKQGDISLWSIDVENKVLDSDLATENFVNTIKNNINSSILNINNSIASIKTNVSTNTNSIVNINKILNTNFPDSSFKNITFDINQCDSSLNYSEVVPLGYDTREPATNVEANLTAYLEVSINNNFGDKSISSSKWRPISELRNKLLKSDTSTINFNFKYLDSSVKNNIKNIQNLTSFTNVIKSDVSILKSYIPNGSLNSSNNSSTYVIRYSIYNGNFIKTWAPYNSNSGSTTYDDTAILNDIALLKAADAVMDTSINLLEHNFINISNTSNTIKIGNTLTSGDLNSLEMNIGNNSYSNSIKLTNSENDVSINGTNGKSTIIETADKILIKVSDDKTPNGKYENTISSSSNIIEINSKKTKFNIADVDFIGNNGTVSINDGSIVFYDNSGNQKLSINPNNYQYTDEKLVKTNWIKISSENSIKVSSKTIIPYLGIFNKNAVIQTITGQTGGGKILSSGNFIKNIFERQTTFGYLNYDNNSLYYLTSLYAYRAENINNNYSGTITLPSSLTYETANNKMFENNGTAFSLCSGWYVYNHLYNYNFYDNINLDTPNDIYSDTTYGGNISDAINFTDNTKQYFTPKSIEQDLYFCVYVYHFNNGVIDGGPYRVWHRWGSGDGNQKIACISNSEKFGIYNRNINLFIGKVNDLFLLNF